MGEILAWAISLAGSPQGILALYLLAFAESAFLPFPSDILLMTCVLAAHTAGNQSLAILLALIATAGSVLGCTVGYIIGKTGGKKLLLKLVSRERMESVHATYEKYEVWTLGAAGFSPIPYSVFTISAGVFYIKFPTFIIVSTLARGVRFVLEALLVFHFGEPIITAIQKHYTLVSVGILILAAVLIALTKRRRSVGNMDDSR